jgi:2-desacetyl-2-hydroxyethyl bacteriochlorophyllide A dehydrogenase
MKAVIFRGDGKADYTDVEIPRIGSGEALIRVERSGICGSDIVVYKGINKRAKYPVIPGHEFVGVVEELPVGYDGPLSLKSRVVAIPTISCGKCWGCTHGLRHICNEIKFLGIQYEGGFCEFAAVPLSNLRTVPDTLSLNLAVLAEPLAVCLHAVSWSPRISGKKVLVFGSGPIGLMTAIVARLEGAEVLVAEPMEQRRKTAGRMGFSTIDTTTADPAAVKREYTGNEGFEVYFECAGHQSTFEFMIATARQRARMVAVATFKSAPAIDVFMMSRKEMGIDTCWTYLDTDCEKALELLNASPEIFKPLITHTFPLCEADEAMRLFIAGGDTLKVCLDVV